MATRRRTAKGKNKPNPTLGNIMRWEIIGSGLVLAAVLIFLSLVSTNRGNVTGAIINFLATFFGAGVWGAPVLLAATGIWLALREVAEPGTFSGWRIAGLTGLFCAVEGFIHLFAGLPDPFAPLSMAEGGGVLGWLLSQGIISALGLPAGIAALVLIGLLSLLALFGKTLADVTAWIAAAWTSLRSAEAPFGGNQGAGAVGPGGPRISPPLPLGEVEPWYRRAWHRLFPERTPEMEPLPLPAIPQKPPTLRNGQPAPVPPAGRTGPGGSLGAGGNGTIVVGDAGHPAGAGSALTRASPGSAFAPQPRIIGGQSWRLPALSEILDENTDQEIQQDDVRRRMHIIEQTLLGFGVPVSVVEVNQGPAVTQFGLRPGTIVRKDRKGEEKHIKVRVSQIQALTNDLSLALAASPIRVEAPVPGRDFVGVEVPNIQISMVSLRGVMESEEWPATKGALKFGLGRDVSGQASVSDLTRMPHLLIAGATGSGKSVCVNAIITSMLLSHTPDTLRFLMVDPKRVELTVYNGIPHLIAPVVVDVERAVPVLQWATREMERRYKLFAKAGARNIESYNEKLAARGELALPYIVILIDELADLMLSAPEEVERYICRIAQMARATGMHLVIATQRPSVDVVTGLIKANFPARIAFAVTSQIDSRVILDTPGAEQLLGRGDMLFMAPDTSKLQRLQGCFISDRETHRLVQYWKGARTFSEPAAGRGSEVPDAGDTIPGAEPAPGWTPARAGAELEPPWLPGQEELQQPLWGQIAAGGRSDRDEMYDHAVEEVRKVGKASTSLLQRRLRIGYSRAARLIEQLEADGIIGPDLGGTRGREVLPPKT